MATEVRIEVIGVLSTLQKIVVQKLTLFNQLSRTDKLGHVIILFEYCTHIKRIALQSN